MRSLKYYLPGSLMILLALLIVAVPEILVIIASSLIIMTGIGALYLGHLFRKVNVQAKCAERAFFDKQFYGFRR